ncbi:MAG: creatininase family protein [Hyphomicrobiales bacterium]|nr:creatininase family protein [Hyphomicrobiales bacterium]
MAEVPTSRILGALTFQDAARAIKETSILCLPLGAIEQHGAHLPLNTDVIVAEGLTGRLLERFGEQFDLWQLPTVSLGLSREHDWAAGTLSLSIDGFVRMLRDLGAAMIRTLPARNLAIINGHGGNRGILENLLHELYGDFGLNAVALHPFDLAGGDPAAIDVHGGQSETAVLLALAPHLVRNERIAAGGPPTPEAARALIQDRGATWGWRSDDPRLARDGVIGDPSGASAALGEALLERMLAAAEPAFAQLLARQRLIGATRSS